MKSEKVLALVLGGVAVAVAGVLSYTQMTDRAVEAIDDQPREQAVRDWVEASVDGTTASEREQLTWESQEEIADASASEVGSEGDEGLGEDELRQAISISIEETLYGSCDPEAFLGIALKLAQLEISDTPIPEPHITGAIRYPLLGAPDGVKAELWIQKSQNENFGYEVLSLRVELDQPDQSMMVEGIVRKAPDAMISLRTNSSGEPVHFGFMTNSDPSAKNRELGIPLDGEFSTGMLYSCYLGDLDEPEASMHGRKDGMPADFARPVSIVSSGWRSAGGIGDLNAAIKKLHTSIKQ